MKKLLFIFALLISFKGYSQCLPLAQSMDSSTFITVCQPNNTTNGLGRTFGMDKDSLLNWLIRNGAGGAPAGNFQDIQINSGNNTFLGGQGTLYNGILTLPNGSGQTLNIGMASPDAVLNVNVAHHSTGLKAIDVYQSEYGYHPFTLAPKGTTIIDQREDYGGHPSALSILAEGSGSSGNAALSVTQNGSSGNAAAIFMNGNVGIGTTTPVTDLDIIGVGNNNISGNFQFSISSSSNNVGFLLNDSAGIGNKYQLSSWAESYPNIGGQFLISDASNGYNLFRLNGDSGRISAAIGDFFGNNNSTIIDLEDSIKQVTFNSFGGIRIGINTLSPLSTLHVVGNIFESYETISPIYNAQLEIVSEIDTITPLLAITNTLSPILNPSLYVANGSNDFVGIGTSSPVSPLSIGSGNQFQINSTGNIVFLNNVATNFPALQGNPNTILGNDGNGNLNWVSTINRDTILVPTGQDSIPNGYTGARMFSGVTATENLVLPANPYQNQRILLGDLGATFSISFTLNGNGNTINSTTQSTVSAIMLAGTGQYELVFLSGTWY